MSHSNIVDSRTASVFYLNRVQNPLHLQLWSRDGWFLRDWNKWNISHNGILEISSSSNRCWRFMCFHKTSLNVSSSISFPVSNESIPGVLISMVTLKGWGSPGAYLFTFLCGQIWPQLNTRNNKQTCQNTD